MSKEFVCVSQSMEIYRTKSQEDAINFVKKENDEWFDYKQKCIDNYEDYADNYIELFIEDDYEKDLQQRIDKAIEYIENNLTIASILNGKTSYCLNDYSFDYNELLSILKGKNNE